MALESGKDGKICAQCREFKQLGDFGRDSTKPGGYHPYCKICKRDMRREYMRALGLRRSMRAGRILVFGDEQAPGQLKDLPEILKLAKHYFRPTTVIHMGDMVDMNWASPYAKDIENVNIERELAEARDYVQAIAGIFPKMIILESNHAEGRMRRMRQDGKVPNILMKNLAELFGYPEGWQVHEEYITDGFVFRHGHKDTKGQTKLITEKMLMRYKQYLNLVNGHHHECFGVSTKHVTVAEKGRLKEVVGAHSGCLMDTNHWIARQYSRGYENVGFLVIEEGIIKPIIPELDHKNRWTGELYWKASGKTVGGQSKECYDNDGNEGEGA